MLGEIYLITNLVNNKKYVGITTRGINARFKEHIKGARSTSEHRQVIHYAIGKHGIENFKVEKLQECSSIEELCTAEITWITKLQSHVTQHGYNVTLTNHLVKDQHHSLETNR